MLTKEDAINKRAAAYISILLKKQGSSIHIRATKNDRHDASIVVQRIEAMLTMAGIPYEKLTTRKLKVLHDHKIS